MTTLTRNGTEGRVYGGDCDLIHIADGKRRAAGMLAAAFIEEQMRVNAAKSGARTDREAETQLLCPGCYMIVLVNAAIELAIRNGQPLSELGVSMQNAFSQVAKCDDWDSACIEEIAVILDDDHGDLSDDREDGE